ncbi:MAG: hypothetical protein M3Q64_01275 [bacterium]|nr:hypothetical protein [bacterium]
MNESVNLKKNTERIWALVFVDYINKKFGCDYMVAAEFDENSFVDVRAVSESGDHPTLEMQLTYAIEMPFIAYEPSDLDYTKKPTQEAIDRKMEKFEERGVDASNLILIIQGYMNRGNAKKAFADSSFKEYAHYPLKGIYYVSPPMISGETNESLQQGMVVSIKDAFET